MDAIRWLAVVVDLDDGLNDRCHQSCSAHLYAELADGRRVVALDDRGWGSSVSTNAPDDFDLWTQPGAAADLEFTARTVVGPDEPPEGMSLEEAESHHWDYLVRLLAERGVATDAATLRGLTMVVELSERVRARLP